MQLILLLIYSVITLVMCHADDIRHGKRDANARVQPKLALLVKTASSATENDAIHRIEHIFHRINPVLPENQDLVRVPRLPDTKFVHRNVWGLSAFSAE